MKKVGLAIASPRTLGRAGFTALTALCLALSLCLLSGCGEKDEAESEGSGLGTVLSIVTSDDPAQATKDLVKGSIQAELTELVFSQGWLDDLLTDIPMSELKKYGIGSLPQLQDYVANLDYEVGNINFNGNSASIDISFEGRTVTVGVELVNGEWQLTNSSKAELLRLLMAS